MFSPLCTSSEYVAVKNLTHKLYILGYPDKLFKPERQVTRAEVATILYRIMSLQKNPSINIRYNDVDPNFWAANYIEAVGQIDLFKGYGDKTFCPDNIITRAELSAVISRYLHLKNVKPMEIHFSDITDSWAVGEIEEIYRHKIITGYKDGTFKPKNGMKRSEMVTMINRLLFRGPLTNVDPSFPDVQKTHWAYGQVEEATKTHEYVRNNDGSEAMTKYIPDNVWE